MDSNARQTERQAPDADEQQIRALVKEWHERTAQNDLEGIVGLMSDDVVFLRCGMPPMGKQEFIAGFKAWSSKARIESRHAFKDLQVSGDLGYAWSHISLVITKQDDGSKTERAGDVLTIFRKSPSGRWTLARDANLLPTPSQD